MRVTKKIARAAAVALLAGSSAVMLGGVAHASDIGTETGGDVFDPATETQVSAVTALQEGSKGRLSTAYYGVMFQGLSSTAYNKELASYGTAFGADSIAGAGTLSTATTQVGALAAAATSKVASLTSYGQSKGFYCGPASGYNILKYGGYSTGKYSGAAYSLSQGNLARSAYMNTDAAGATKWSTDRFRIGLNRWIYGKDTGFYVSKHAPTASYVTNAIVYDMSFAKPRPFGADTVELAGGKHYNGHPNRTIGHWLTAYGYASSGKTIYFADPSFSVYANAASKFTATTSSFTTSYLQSNGITW